MFSIDHKMDTFTAKYINHLGSIFGLNGKIIITSLWYYTLGGDLFDLFI